MHVSPVVNSKFIYQYGNVPDDTFVFYKGRFDKLVQTSVKEVTDSAAFIQGEVDRKSNNALNKGSYLLEVDFTNQYNSPYTIDFINKIFFGAPKYAFFFDYGRDTNNKYAETDINKFYFNPHVRSVQPPNLSETERENRYDGEYQESVTMKMAKPFFYDCTDEIEYVNYQDYIDGVINWGSTTWGGSYWGSVPGAFGLVSSLTGSKTDYFADLEPKDINYLLRLRDRFFERDTTQTSRRYVVDATFASGAFTDVALTDTFDEVTANTRIYRFEFDALAPGQSITIQNLNNSSGIKITWVGDAANSESLVFNSYYGRLYSGATESDVLESNYTIEVIGDDSLFFTGLLNPFRISALSREVVRVTPSAGSNIELKIDVLPTYD